MKAADTDDLTVVWQSNVTSRYEYQKKARKVQPSAKGSV